MPSNTITLYLVETDDLDKGIFYSLEEATAVAKEEDYIIAVSYIKGKETILKRPSVFVTLETKKSTWLVVSTEKNPPFCIDSSDFTLDIQDYVRTQNKEKIFAIFEYSFPSWIRSSDDIKGLSLQKNKFGVRLVGDAPHSTEWEIFKTLKAAKEEAEVLKRKALVPVRE